MNKKVILWGVGSIVIYSALYYLMVHTGYLYHVETSKYITIIQYSSEIEPSLLASLIFAVVLLVVFTLIGLLKKDWLHNRFLFFMLLLPSYPAITGIINVLVGVFKRDRWYYNKLGSRFSAYYFEDYPGPMNFDDYNQLASQLRYGAGLYLAILLFLLIIVNTWAIYYTYHRKFIKDYY